MGYIGTKPSAVPLTSADITDGIITSAKIADGTIVNADINASAAIVSTKLSGVQGKFESALLHVRDEKAQNTSGGSSSSGSFQKRTLNTTLTNEISGASISSSVITLPSGTYYINARIPFYGDNQQTKVKLRNTSDSTDTLFGNNSYMNAGMINDFWIIGRFTIAAQKDFELQYRVAASVSSEGLGHQSNFATEVYADCQIWKVA